MKFTDDDVRDIAIRIVDELVKHNYINDCIDTDDTDEFEVQDICFDVIREGVDKHLSKPFLTSFDYDNIKSVDDFVGEVNFDN